MCLVGVDTLWVVNGNSSVLLKRLSSTVSFLVFVQCSTGGFAVFANSSEGSVTDHAASKAHGNLEMVEVSKPLS